MNNRVLKYVVGLGLFMGVSLLHAGTQRSIGQQSRAGVKALNEHAATQADAVRSAKEVERIKREQAAKERGSQSATTEELDLSADVSGVAPHGAETDRLVSTNPTAPVAVGAIPGVTYGAKDAAYQTAIVAALNDVVTNDVAIVDAADAGLGADLIKLIAGLATVPASKDPTVVLHDAIVTVLAANNREGGMRLAFTLAGLKAALGVAAAGISDVLLASIVADVQNGLLITIGAGVATPTFPAGGIHVNTLVAAAAFGVQFADGAWKVKRSLSLANIPGTADVLHFHEGDFHPEAGFFMGLDATGNYAGLSADNQKYALSRVDLTPNGYAVPPVTPIAPEKVKLNADASPGGLANPIHGKGLTHLLLGAGQKPVVVTANDQTNVHMVANYVDGSEVLTTADTANPVVTPFPLKDATSAVLNNATGAKIFDIATTTKPTQFSAAAPAPKNLIFAAVADKPDLSAATIANTGIAVMSVEADHLAPLDTGNTAAAGGAVNTAKLLPVTQAGGVLAVGNNAAFADAGDINLWYDDRYRQVFGTVAGIKPGNAGNDVAYGLFHGMWDGGGDTFVIKPMIDVTGHGKILAGSEKKVAASIFGAQVTTNYADAATGKPVVNLYRPRTMHTSTDKNYLLVTGGVQTQNNPASRAWVNALPLLAPAAPGNPHVGGAGDLAKKDDLTAAIAAGAEAPTVSRTDASASVVDAYTPFIVGRYPSYLAPVEGGVRAGDLTIQPGKSSLYQDGTTFAAGSKIESTALKPSQLKGEVTFVGNAPNAKVTLSANAAIPAGVELSNKITFDETLELGMGTAIGEESKFRVDTNLVGGDLAVRVQPITVKQDSVLAVHSKLGGDTVLVGGGLRTLGEVADVPVLTDFDLTSEIKAGSVLMKGSEIHQDLAHNIALDVGAGGIVTFKTDAPNQISKQAVTNLKMKAENNPVGLHLAEENVANTAVELLKAEATRFAVKPAFVVGAANGAVAAEFTGVANGYLGALGNNDGKNALIPVVNGAGPGQVLEAPAPATGKAALAKLSTIIADQYAGHPTLAHGFAVADAIMKQAAGAANNTTPEVYDAALTKAKALTGVDDADANIALRDYSTKLFTVAANTPEKILDSGLRAAIAMTHGSADAKKMVQVGAHATRLGQNRDTLNRSVANQLTKNQALSYAACFKLIDESDVDSQAARGLFNAVAADLQARTALLVAHGNVEVAALAAGGMNVHLNALNGNPLAKVLLEMAAGDTEAHKDAHVASLLFAAAYATAVPVVAAADAATLVALQAAALSPASITALHTAITHAGGATWTTFRDAAPGAGGGEKVAVDGQLGANGQALGVVGAIEAVLLPAAGGNRIVLANAVAAFVNVVHPLQAAINDPVIQANVVHLANVGAMNFLMQMIKAIVGDSAARQLAIQALVPLSANAGALAAIGGVHANPPAIAALNAVGGHQASLVALGAVVANASLRNVAADPLAKAALISTGNHAAAEALLRVGGVAAVAGSADLCRDIDFAGQGLLANLVLAAPNNPDAIAALLDLEANAPAAVLIQAIAASAVACAALSALAPTPQTLIALINFARSRGPIVDAAVASLGVLVAVLDALTAMDIFAGDVGSLAGVVALGMNDPDGGLQSLETMFDDIRGHGLALTPDEKFIITLSSVARNQPLGNFDQQRNLLALAIEEAYKGVKTPLAETWANPAVVAALPAAVGVKPWWAAVAQWQHGGNPGQQAARAEIKKAVGFLDAFKQNIVGGHGVAGVGDDKARLSAVFDAGLGALVDVPTTLKAMVKQSVDVGYFENDKMMQVLHAAIQDPLVPANGYKAVGGWSNAKMAQAAVQKYLANQQIALGNLRESEKYLEKFAGSNKPLGQRAGADMLFYNQFSDPVNLVPYKDSGFTVLNAVSAGIYANGDVAANNIPAIAYNALGGLPGATVPAPAGEFLAGRSAIDFVPQADFPITAAGTVIGSGSELCGVTVTGANDVWQFGAGVTLPVGTTLPAWTLFKKGLATDYNPGLNTLTGAPAPALAPGAPWGGQWVLADVPALDAAGRAKLTVATADLQLKSIDDGIKIAADRKIKSNNGAAVAAHEKYTLYLPAGTLLPAGTTIYNNMGAGAPLNVNVGAGELDFSQPGNVVNDGANKTFTDNATVGAGWDVPAGITIEFPEYPTKLAAGAVLPAGTRVKNMAAGASDKSGLINDAVGPILGLNFANANDYFTLPSNGTVQAAGIDGAANLQIDHDPLFTKGIIRGSFNPVSKLTQQYKPNVNLTLAKWTPQRFAPGTVLPMNTELESAVIHPVAPGEEVFVALPADKAVVGYEGSLAKGSALAPLTQFTGQTLKPEAADLVVNVAHTFNDNELLPPGTTFVMQNAFAQNWSNRIQAIAADGTLHDIPNLDKAGVPVAGAAVPVDLAGIDCTNGFKIHGGNLDINTMAADTGLHVTIPQGLVLDKEWQLGQDLVLPPQTTFVMQAGFQQDWQNKIQAVNAAGVRQDIPNLAKAGVVVGLGGELLTLGALDHSKGFAISGAALDINTAANTGLRITIPNGKAISNANLKVLNAPATLNAKVNFESSGAPASDGVAIHGGSVLTQGTNFKTGMKVLATADFPVRYAGDNLQNLKTLGDPVPATDRLKITNADVTVLSGKVPLSLTAAGGGTPNYTQVKVGAEPLTLAADLVVAGGVTKVSGGSQLAANTKFHDVELMVPFKLGVGDEVLNAGSVIKAGSSIKADTAVGNAGGDNLEVASASLRLSVAHALECKETKLAGASKAGVAGSVLKVLNGGISIKLPDVPQVVWNLGANESIATDGVQIDIGNLGEITLGEGSLIKDGSNIVTTDSGYAVSATDMQVIGDSVYIGLEGDRSEENGIEAGVFKSTALFDTTGKVRGWTPWQRVGANNDATAFFGYNSNTGNLVYLTSPDGKAFNDTATGTLVNPATTVKLTQWGRGDDGALHAGQSLGRKLATIFGGSITNPGVYGLFDFDPDTYCFNRANRRYEDPHFSCMVATGNEKVALVQTGARDGFNFAPTQKFDDNTVLTFGAADGLAGLGRITCAEFTRNDLAVNWLFVGGENGLAVLAKKADGDGLPARLDKLVGGAFNRADYAFHKVLDLAGAPFKNVRRIVADEATGYVYVVTKDVVLRINTNAAFKGAVSAAGDGKLVHGDLATPANTYVKVATAEKSNAYDKGVNALAIDPAGANGGSLLQKGISATQAGEFTDLAILKSLDNKTLDTRLMLATTNGLFADSVGITNAFAGDDAAVCAKRWEKIETSAKQPAPYDSQDINARAGIAAAAGAANMDGLADAVTAIVGTVAGCARAVAGVGHGLGLNALDFNREILPMTRKAAISVGAPAALVELIAPAIMNGTGADQIFAAMVAVPLLIALTDAVIADPDFAAYDNQTKMNIIASVVAADIQLHAGGAGTFIGTLPGAGAAAPGTAAGVRGGIRALPAGGVLATVAAQILELKSAYGDDVMWLDQVAVQEVAQTSAGLKTVLRLEPVNLHSGGCMMKVGNDHSFEGNINVYATDNSNSELRLYRLDASNGVAKGIVEVTNKDEKKNVLPYFAQLGRVNSELIHDLNTNFFLKAVDASGIDDMIASGGVSSLINVDMVMPAVGAGDKLSAGGEYSSSLNIPQLSTVMNSASGAAYMPTSDGARVNE